jgi:hypothetical protein
MKTVTPAPLVITLLIAEQNPPGASLLVLHPTELTPAQQLAALRRALADLERRLGATDDPAAIEADVEVVLRRFLASRGTAGPGNRPGWSDPAAYRDCVDCGHRFHIDSSPDLDRDWQCAERRDAELEAAR